MITSVLIIANAIIAIALQAAFPQKRHVILLVCASAALLFGIQTSSLPEFLGNLPWDTVLILFALTIYGEFIFGSNIFDWVLKQISILCKGKLYLIIIVFNIIVFLVSSVLNNYQALLLMLPPLISLLKLMNNLSKRYLTILFSSVLIISNLAGASTPIGDFPALYLLSQGVISFGSYFANTTPFAILAGITVIVTAVIFYRVQPVKSSEQSENLSVAYTTALYRRVNINWKMLIPSIIIFIMMFVCWLLGYNPTIVALVGLSILSIIVKLGKYAENKITSVDPSVFIYFICLFIIIESIQQTGVLNIIANYLQLIKSPRTLIILFSLTTMIITGLVSAGPATVAFFPVAMTIQDAFPENMVITCFCLSICAGSSLFLTAATAGPLLTRMTEKNTLVIDNANFVFSFKNYLIPGMIGAMIIFSSNLLYIMVKL